MSDTGATGHAWPCTRFYVTASDRDRCTCPVSDTGVVERAAREDAENWCLDPTCYRDAHDHTRRDGYYSD